MAAQSQTSARCKTPRVHKCRQYWNSFVVARCCKGYLAKALHGNLRLWFGVSPATFLQIGMTLVSATVCVCVYNATVDQLIPRHSEVVRKSVAGPSCDDPRTSEGKLLLAAPVNYCILANHGKPNLMGGRYEEGASTDPPACCWIPLPRLQVHKRTGPALAKIL